MTGESKKAWLTSRGENMSQPGPYGLAHMSLEKYELG